MRRIVPIPISVEEWTLSLTRWDAFAMLLVLGLLVFLAEASVNLLEPLKQLEATPLSLAPAHLPEYAARTTLRMLVALLFSLLFTFTYATLAAKSARAELLLVPLLDILQSVPILGFVSVTIVFFMSLAPGKVLGAEFAAIFAIFTSQAWNMAFSFYQSLRTVPAEVHRRGRSCARHRPRHLGRRRHLPLSDLREMGRCLQKRNRRRAELPVDRLRRGHQAD